MPNYKVIISPQGRVIQDGDEILVESEDGQLCYIHVDDLCNEFPAVTIGDNKKHQNESNESSEEDEDIEGPECILDEVEDNEISSKNEKQRLWTRETTESLMDLYKKFEKDFEKTLKKNVWQKIAKRLTAEFNIVYTTAQVENKWKSLIRTYKEVLKRNNTTGSCKTNWLFFNQMHQIMYKRPEIEAVATCSSHAGLTLNKNLENNETVNKENLDSSSSSLEYESMLTRKRKIKESAVEKRHREKMMRLDTLQNTLDKLVHVLGNRNRANENDSDSD